MLFLKHIQKIRITHTLSSYLLMRAHSFTPRPYAEHTNFWACDLEFGPVIISIENKEKKDEMKKRRHSQVLSFFNINQASDVSATAAAAALSVALAHSSDSTLTPLGLSNHPSSIMIPLTSESQRDMFSDRGEKRPTRYSLKNSLGPTRSLSSPPKPATPSSTTIQTPSEETRDNLQVQGEVPLKHSHLFGRFGFSQPQLDTYKVLIQTKKV